MKNGKKYFCGTHFFSSNVHISGLIGSRMLKFGDFLDNTHVKVCKVSRGSEDHLVQGLADFGSFSQKMPLNIN